MAKSDSIVNLANAFCGILEIKTFTPMTFPIVGCKKKTHRNSKMGKLKTGIDEGSLFLVYKKPVAILNLKQKQQNQKKHGSWSCTRIKRLLKKNFGKSFRICFELTNRY